MSNRAWVTLATNDSYGLGALVLAHSLRRVGSSHPTVVLITPSVTDPMRERLRAVFSEVVIVDVLDSKDAAHLALLQRPELGITFTKIHCWGLTQYEKCVFLDADTLVVQNCDELFERDELSAAPDVGWPDCFNSGVFVYTPSSETFDALIKFAQERGSFDGGDQGLLNSFFSDWARGDINKHLPFLYNVTSAAFYSYLPALKHYGQNLKIIHFIGAAKPWLQQYNWESHSVDAPDHLRELLQLWWDLFVGQVHHQLDATMVEDVELEASPALPPPDVAHHYAPKLDPESEFPWHHPDAQIPENSLADQHKLDMTEFYDPWQNYRGNIPPIPNPEALDDRQALREYAWEHQSQKEQTSNVWQEPSGHSHDNPHWHHHEPTHDHHSHSHEYRDHNWDDHSHIHSHEQSFHGHHQTNEHHGDWHQVHETGQFVTSHEHPAEPEHHITHHEHGSHEHGHSQYPHDHHYDHTSHINHNHNSEQLQKESSKDSQSHHEIHQSLNNTQIEYITNRSQLYVVHHVHIDYDSTPIDKSGVEDVSIKINGVNGDISETDSEDHEDIKPRHPYDNFYLRHRATIDSRGRKICSHEIPPAPSTSPTPESISPSESPSPEEDFVAEVENQSGVAGNLARVVPGSGSQREALDELTRRQGWEAGNIDYMGADSFDNIWAKISQTLSQPRSSPPKEAPPKQPSPPKESAKQPSPPKEVQAEPKVEAPVEEKPTEVPAATEADVEAAGKETPVSPPVPSPAEALAPAPATPTPVEPAPVEAPVKVEAPAAVEAPAPVEAPASVESPAPVKAPAPVEAPVPAPAEAPSTPAPEAPLKAEPAGVAGPVEAAAPVEAPKESKEKTDKIEVPPTPPATPKSTPEPSTPVDVPPAVEALLAQKLPEATVEPASPVASPEVPKALATPEKALDASAVSSDSPPLANTPSKEEAPAAPAAKSEERGRRKPAGKLQLSPPAAADALATPDSELEDAAALAHSIIASELRTPTVSAPTPPAPASPAAPASPGAARLAVAEPALPTPPVAAVSLAQIGVKPKGKSTAAQIESSVSESADTPTTPTTPTSPDAKDAPKKKTVKKTAKKEGDAPAPVPPPRKKEKKPKEK